jgi:hypothetical protein
MLPAFVPWSTFVASHSYTFLFLLSYVHPHMIISFIGLLPQPAGDNEHFHNSKNNISLFQISDDQFPLAGSRCSIMEVIEREELKVE